ncbi:MAG: 2-hydroxychromene-2-carboxylate isomerase [Pseudomonadota bacterium]
MTDANAAIDFYFDLTSPYGYLASERIEDIALKHGRSIRWRPILLGAVFKISGARPLLEVPLLDEYSRVDMPRSAREHNIPFTLPDPFPVATVAAARTVYWVELNDPGNVPAIVHALLRAYFVENINIGDAENVLDVAAASGVNRDTLAAALQDPAIKARLKDAVDEAIETKVFGSPYFIVDGEHFWGNDRMDQMDRWLHSGGW